MQIHVLISDTNILHVSRFSVNLSLNSSKKVISFTNSMNSTLSGKTPTKRSDCKSKKTPSKCKKSPS